MSTIPLGVWASPALSKLGSLSDPLSTPPALDHSSFSYQSHCDSMAMEMNGGCISVIYGCHFSAHFKLGCILRLGSSVE